MEKAKFRPLATPKPLNRSSQKLAGVITSWTAPGMQNFVAIGSERFRKYSLANQLCSSSECPDLSHCLYFCNYKKYWNTNMLVEAFRIICSLLVRKLYTRLF